MTAKTLIEGEGAEVKETDTVYVRYIGVQYSDGKVVDGNYDRRHPDGHLPGRALSRAGLRV